MGYHPTPTYGEICHDHACPRCKVPAGEWCHDLSFKRWDPDQIRYVATPHQARLNLASHRKTKTDGDLQEREVPALEEEQPAEAARGLREGGSCADGEGG